MLIRLRAGSLVVVLELCSRDRIHLSRMGA